ncbi:hypothetical protein EMIHUDRAFT_207667 [Emiliania huxleyi CCMP1516]|uniref:Uncharacterized protein n=2 Tax=Emiliania huxleyi TaxID=2903 RepID=A0A0D3JDT4_EMIH1|nr:hypothetical protein EMIHUDRAFT_207667 [Emiliania huxleyi CCMP1516]EOD21669.1 hypothetical protein EMIHUDRAFT_207667 [Emiliania huxleyi CCMP1516]|eukprot:XP_005774098.1 hypothetical protein EMIHUDRAFT_207667 [Emiliania huxleyi CCMP1516]
MKDKVRNKLSKRQHEDEASWSTRSWLSLQAQRMSVALQLAAAEEIATELRLAAAPPSRSFADFESFWPLYVQQHSLTTTKLLHGVGTTLVVLSIAVRLGAASSICLSLLGADATASCSSGLPEAAVMVSLLMGVVRLYSGLPPSQTAEMPATFSHPTFSLIGDFALLGSLLTGRLSLNATSPAG